MRQPFNMASMSSKVEKREPLEKVTLLGPNKAKDTVASHGVTLSRHRRYIFNGLAASLCLGVGTLLSMAASESLAVYGNQYEFRYRESEIDLMREGAAFVVS